MPSNPIHNFNTTRISWLLIAAFAVFRLAFAGSFPLVADEAYYWQWSRHLAAAYYDHPPMIAWMISLATHVLGNTETAVRLPAVVSHTLCIIYLFRMAGKWLHPRVALLTVILAQSILGFNAAGLISTPDSPLLLAWAGAAYHVGCAYTEGKRKHWLMGGAWFGFGLLSKATMIIFPVLVFMPGILHSPSRKQLARPWPYLGLLLGILLFLPVILWNMDNHWSTFRHAAHQGGVDRESVFHLKYSADFLISQMGLLSPIVAVLLPFAWVSSITSGFFGKKWLSSYLFMTSLPVIAAFTVLSLHTRVEGNWAAPGYLTASVLMAAYVVHLQNSAVRRNNKPGTLRLWPWAIITSYALTALILAHVMWALLPVPVKLDRIARETAGWDLLGRKLQRMKTAMPNPEKTFFFALKYQAASQVAFYAPGNPDTIAINRWSRPNAYEYWYRDEDFLGWDAVGVGSASSKNTRRLKQIFDHVDAPERLDIYRKKPPYPFIFDKTPVSAFYVYRAYGYKGGSFWIPERRSDVRAVQP